MGLGSYLCDLILSLSMKLELKSVVPSFASTDDLVLLLPLDHMRIFSFPAENTPDYQYPQNWVQKILRGLSELFVLLIWSLHVPTKSLHKAGIISDFCYYGVVDFGKFD